MRRGRIFFLLALIIVIGFALVYFAYSKGLIFPQAGGTSEAVNEALFTATPIATTKVVVVTQQVQRGDIITADKLDMVDYQSDLVLPIMFTDVNQVVGKMARYTMDPYTVVTSALVTGSPITEQGSDDALFISPGMVAVSIPITRLSSVSYAPERGDHVNVIVTMLFVDLDPAWQTMLPNWTGNVIGPGGGVANDGTLFALPIRGASEQGRPETDPLVNQTFYILPSEQQRPRLVSQTLIQNVIVLQMGNFLTPAEKAALEATQPAATATPEPGTEQAQQQAPPTPTPIPAPPDVITLIVSPQDAVTLNYLIYGGAQLTLVLRNPRDADVNATEAVTLSYLLDQYNIPIPVKLPYGFQPAVTSLAPPSLQNDTTPTPQP
ncbi:MAG: SAF domain-containing protein [Anaerolineales bacterium]|jgi:pilus assembly protein CpaB